MEGGDERGGWQPRSLQAAAKGEIADYSASPQCCIEAMNQCGGRVAGRGHLEGRPQRRLNRSIRKSLGRQGGLFSGLGSEKYGHEFVAAESGEHDCGACGLPQTFGSGMKHRIASQEAIPEVIPDDLEDFLVSYNLVTIQPWWLGGRASAS